MHFEKEAGEPDPVVVEKQPETLAEAAGEKAVEQQPVPGTVSELAEATGATVDLIKELLGKRQANQKVTPAEVSEVVRTLKKAE